MQCNWNLGVFLRIVGIFLLLLQTRQRNMSNWWFLKFISFSQYWSSAKPRGRLMGLPLPRLQPSSSPRCCRSRPLSQLTDATVQLKRYNQFRTTRAPNWVSVMSIVAQPALIYTTCTQFFRSTNQPVKGHFVPNSLFLGRQEKRGSNQSLNTGMTFRPRMC